MLYSISDKNYINFFFSLKISQYKVFGSLSSYQMKVENPNDEQLLELLSDESFQDWVKAGAEKPVNVDFSN